MAEKAAQSQNDKASAGGEAAAPDRGACTAPNCKQAVRAKGYCRKHYQAWRRGTLGGHHRYKTCTKEGCRKKREFGSLCAEHAGKGESAS
jgi:hypothetical protein